MVFASLWSCSNEEPNLTINDIEFWVGEYEIHTIGGQEVDCSIIYLEPETIVIGVEEFQVLSRCGEGRVMIDGRLNFEQGLFNLFVSSRVQDPDLPEFQMQIFQNDDNEVRIYRCANGSSNCTIRSGSRIK